MYQLVIPVTPDVLNKLSMQFQQSSALVMDEKDNLLSLVIHLICRSGSGAFKLLGFLLDTASGDGNHGDGSHGDKNKVNDLVQQTCALILVRKLDILMCIAWTDVHKKVNLMLFNIFRVTCMAPRFEKGTLGREWKSAIILLILIKLVLLLICSINYLSTSRFLT